LNLGAADAVGDSGPLCSAEAANAAEANSIIQTEFATGNHPTPTQTPTAPVPDLTIEILDAASSLTLFGARSPISFASLGNSVDLLHVPVRILMSTSILGPTDDVRPLPSFCQLPISPTFQPVQGAFDAHVLVFIFGQR
jgi:hypothetical protein